MRHCSKIYLIHYSFLDNDSEHAGFHMQRPHMFGTCSGMSFELRDTNAIYRWIWNIVTFDKEQEIVIFKLKTTWPNEKGWYLTQSFDKSLYINRKIQKSSKVTTQKRHQNFDYKTMADRLRMTSWSNDSYLTGVVKPVYGIPTFPLTTKAV